MALMPPRRSARLSSERTESDGLGSSPLRSRGSSYTITTAKVPAGAAASSNASRNDAAKRPLVGGPSNSTDSSSRSSSNRNLTSGAGSEQKGDLGNSSSTTTSAFQSIGKRKERRLEDIQSDDEDDEDVSGDFMTGFARPVISGNAKHAASIPVPRQPRTTFREETGDDGFIFSVTGANNDVGGSGRSSSSTRDHGTAAALIPGAKGPPPRSSLAQHKALPTSVSSLRLDRDGADNRSLGGLSDIPATPAMITGRRVSSSSVKAVRRVSLLRDGTPAYPHPTIADADLFRHCSSDLDVRDRLRHLTLWTLDRSLKKALSQLDGPSTTRGALEKAIRATLQGLSKGDLPLEWPAIHASAASSSSAATAVKGKQTHPRNEANRKAEKDLKQTVEAMERENRTWQRAREDLQRYESETQILVGTAAIDQELTSVLNAKYDEPANETARHSIRQALATAAPWLKSESVPNSSIAADVSQTAGEIYQKLYVGPVPAARPAKRRRTTLTRGDGDETSNAEQSADGEQAIDSPLRGTEADSRWHEVEWNVDQLRVRTHALSQLARLSEHFTMAVSARGAQAMGELMSGARVEDAHAAAIVSSLADEERSSSRVTRESQQTLQRILSGIRKIQRDDATPPSAEHPANPVATGSSKVRTAPHPGDISDGDLLRAFAGVRKKA